MKQHFLLLTLLLGFSWMHAQEKFTISGSVTDAKSGELLIGAIVRSGDLGCFTNEYGYYSLTLPKGVHTLRFQSMGYDTVTYQAMMDKDRRVDIALSETYLELEEVVITGQAANAQVEQAQMGMVRLDVKEIAKVPVIFGERDILKTLQLMPGVKSTGEGNGGLYVRGGDASQNLILLDEAPVYNAYHLLGFFSTFNSDAIKDVALYKGTAPAQYGGRLSSVIDVKMNEGNNQSYHMSGGIGLISSHLNVEGPIVKDKASFLVTGRRTYADMFLKLSNNEQLNSSKLYFYDLNAKVNATLNENNRIYASGYFGRDQLGLSGFGIDWGNATGTLRWNHLINSKWFSNTSFIYSNYDYKVGIEDESLEFSLKSSIQDFNIQQEFQYYPQPKHNIRIGFNAIHHTVTPGQLSLGDSSDIQPAQVEARKGLEEAAYLAGEWELHTRLRLNYGLRLSAFQSVGAGNFYLYDEDGNLSDTLTQTKSEIGQTYGNLEPRLSISWLVDASSSIKLAYTRNTQYIHMISNATSTSPTDVWLLSSVNVKPEIADQVSLGYFRNFQDNSYEFSAETYFKLLHNQIDLRNGADIMANELIEGELVVGDGRAYGLELLLKKTRGRFSGWLGYTLSRTERQIQSVNDGNWYPAKQDATHDVSVVGMVDISKAWTLSATWVYKTGNAVTFPTGKYYVDGQVQYLYTERNGYRLPAYHRLDVGATYTRKKHAKFESSWNFSCYNAYGRENPFSVDFREDPDDPSKTQAVQTALFKWVPSITYNFKF